MEKNKKTRHSKVFDLIRLLVSIDQNGARTAKQIAHDLDMQHVTMTRLMQKARREYNVEIERPLGTRGVYKITNWGLLDRGKIYDLFMADAVTVRTRPRLI